MPQDWPGKKPQDLVAAGHFLSLGTIFELSPNTKSLLTQGSQCKRQDGPSSMQDTQDIGATKPTAGIAMPSLPSRLAWRLEARGMSQKARGGAWGIMAPTLTPTSRACVVAAAPTPCRARQRSCAWLASAAVRGLKAYALSSLTSSTMTISVCGAFSPSASAKVGSTLSTCSSHCERTIGYIIIEAKKSSA